MTTRTIFTPAGSATANTTQLPANYPMPAVDGGNLDTQIVCNIGAVWIAFGAGAAVGPTAPGSILLTPGVPILLTSNATTLGACVTSPFVIGGQTATTAAAAAACSAMSMFNGATLTVTRGTASSATQY